MYNNYNNSIQIDQKARFHSLVTTVFYAYSIHAVAAEVEKSACQFRNRALLTPVTRDLSHELTYT
jgi:hypothetical protein